MLPCSVTASTALTTSKADSVQGINGTSPDDDGSGTDTEHDRSMVRSWSLLNHSAHHLYEKIKVDDEKEGANQQLEDQQQQQRSHHCQQARERSENLPGGQSRIYSSVVPLCPWGSMVAHTTLFVHPRKVLVESKSSSLCSGDMLSHVLSFMIQSDRLRMVSTCRWLRQERLYVLRELDMRQPQQGPAADCILWERTATLGEKAKSSCNTGSSVSQSCASKATGMLEALEVSEEDVAQQEEVSIQEQATAGGELLIRQRHSNGKASELSVSPIQGSTLERSAVSLLQHTPLLRRMRYRGEVHYLTRALTCPATPPLRQLLALDLCETSMNARGAKCLAAAFAEGVCPQLGHLDLSDNPEIGEAGAGALGRALEDGALPHLQGLLLFGDRIQNGGLAIARAMASGNLSNLEILDLSGAGLGTACVVELSRTLESGHCPRLEQLGLSDNNVEELGVQCLALALGVRASAGCSHLEKLHVGGNVVGSGGAQKLAQALRRDGCGSRLSLLELHSARLGGEGIREITEALKAGACGGLRELWLDDNTENGERRDEAVHDIMEVLASGALPALQALGLNWTGLGGSGAAALALALTIFPRPNLHRLDLRSTSITGLALAPLADALSRHVCPSLRWLDVSGNALFLSGARELARALKAGAGSNLRRLDLHAVGLEWTGIREIAGALQQRACPELMGLGLALNRIGHQGAVMLGEAIAAGGLAKLVGLELHKNELGDAGVVALTDVLASGSCPMLMYLGMSTSRATDVGAQALVEGIRKGPGLARLERLNLQDNWIGRQGLARLEDIVSVVAARGGRLRLELSGNGTRQIVSREAGWILNSTKRACVGLLVGGGTVIGALAINLVTKRPEYRLALPLRNEALQSTIMAILYFLGALIVGIAQGHGLLRSWDQGSPAGDFRTNRWGSFEVGLAGQDMTFERRRVPGYVMGVVILGDVAVTSTGMQRSAEDFFLLLEWTIGIIVGIGLTFQLSRYR